jgi:peroxiredoxin Q/BCP
MKPTIACAPVALALVLVLVAGTPACASGKGGLAVGDAAPAFSLPGSDGKTHSLEQHLGKRAVVLAWFPKAFTGG